MQNIDSYDSFFKNFLKCTQTQESLNDLAVIHVETELVQKIDFNEITNISLKKKKAYKEFNLVRSVFSLTLLELFQVMFNNMFKLIIN